MMNKYSLFRPAQQDLPSADGARASETSVPGRMHPAAPLHGAPCVTPCGVRPSVRRAGVSASRCADVSPRTDVSRRSAATRRTDVFRRALLSLVAFLSLGLLHTSCDEHEVPIDYSLKVGNIYCYDGTIIPPAAYDESRHVPVGVIVAMGDSSAAYSAIAVAMDETQSFISDTLDDLDGVGEGRDDMNGKANTAAMMTVMAEDSTVFCPAADFVRRFQRGGGAWYIPSCGELRKLAAVRGEVSRTMELIGGKPFSREWYLSSSQDDTSEETRKYYMLNVSLTEGRVMSSRKNAVHTLRPFLLIQ